VLIRADVARLDYPWQAKGVKANGSSPVTCYGEQVSMDTLRSYLYRSGRPINWDWLR